MFRLTLGKCCHIIVGVLFCQIAAGSQICVIVTDPSDLPVPAALITTLRLSTSKYYSDQADSKGHACVSNIPEGLYSVEASATGFLNVRYYPVHVTPAAPINLAFRLPFGETYEGGVGEDAVLVGTLRRGTSPVPFASICALDEEAKNTVRCVQTTDIGEYAIRLAPGTYVIEIRNAVSGEVRPLFVPHNKGPSSIYRIKTVLPSPGTYSNLLAVPES